MMVDKQKNLLAEVVFIRPLLILLLILYHSFIIYQGGWSEPPGFVPNNSYWWISKLSFSFMLESFVFISGYIFSFQVQTKEPELIDLLFNKFKRLIIPSIFFSSIYFLIFCNYESSGRTIYHLLKGVGHMWYLPMLFWCFVIMTGLIKFCKKKELNITILVMLLLMSLVSYIPMPLRLNNTMYYLLFFYLGYLSYNYRSKFSKVKSLKCVVLSWTLFILVFVLFTEFREYFRSLSEYSNSIPHKAICLSISKACQVFYASLGVFSVYITSVFISDRFSPSSIFLKLGSLSMGVYILQQFVLQFIYYKTEIPIWVGSFWLPWVGALLALMISIIGASILKKIPFLKNMV